MGLGSTPQPPQIPHPSPFAVQKRPAAVQYRCGNNWAGCPTHQVQGSPWGSQALVSGRALGVYDAQTPGQVYGAEREYEGQP